MGRALAQFSFKTRGTSCIGGDPNLTFVDRAGKKRIYTKNFRQLSTTPTCWLTIYHASYSSGFWAITRTTTTAAVTLNTAAGTEFSAQERAEIRSGYIDYYVLTHPDFASVADKFRIADGAATTHHFGGYLHNAISVLSLAGFAACTAIQRPWRWLRRTPTPGLCVNCKYDLSATPIGACCPECGTEPA